MYTHIHTVVVCFNSDAYIHFSKILISMDSVSAFCRECQLPRTGGSCFTDERHKTRADFDKSSILSCVDKGFSFAYHMSQAERALRQEPSET